MLGLAAIACDLLLAGGTLVDGTGAARKAANVAIHGDRVVHVGKAIRCAKVLDVHGLVVTPGFIDVLGQGRAPLLDGDGVEPNKLLQGVTTDVLGEGWTDAPTARLPSFDAWLRALDAHHNAVNVAAFVGGTTLRQSVLGDSARAPTAAELARMRDFMQQAMDQGALGLAAALIYPPGSYASTAELVEVAKPVGAAGGVYATHLRSEGDRVFDALDEAVHVARATGARLEIFHFKAMGRRNWPRFAEVVRRVEASGVDYGADTFPYLKSGTLLSALAPPWASADGKLVETLRTQRARVRAALDADDWENLASLATPEGVMLLGAGKTLAQLAAERGVPWEDALIDLLVETRGEGNVLLDTMSEENLRARLRLPWVTFGTDAGARQPSDARGAGHPRAMGTYPRLLATYVRDLRLLSLEEAVRRMTSLPARRLRLRDRGVVRAGAFADLAVFDLAQLSAPATYEQPALPPTGMRHVFVNGEAVLLDGRITAARPGRALRRDR